MPVWIVTGANRGLGLEFVRQLATDKDNTIFAGIRTTQTDTADLKKAIGDATSQVKIVVADTSDQKSVYDFADQVTKELNGTKIDYLLNVAAINAQPDVKILSKEGSSSSVPSTGLSSEAFTSHMDINVLGPATLIAALDPLLKSGSVVMNMTSGLGSLANTKAMQPRKCAIYSISKAAINMLTLHLDDEFKSKGKDVICIVVDPGWVKTRMGGEGAEIDADESIGGMLKTLRGLKKEDSGKFYHYSGKEIPW